MFCPVTIDWPVIGPDCNASQKRSLLVRDYARLLNNPSALIIAFRRPQNVPKTALSAPKAAPKRAQNDAKWAKPILQSFWARFGTVLGAERAVLGTKTDLRLPSLIDYMCILEY